MEHAQRKSTRLRVYDYSENGVYFVTICTKDKKKTLCNIVGGGRRRCKIVQIAKTVLRLLEYGCCHILTFQQDPHDAPQIQLTAVGRIVEKYIRSTDNISCITVDKYVIMPNHVHLLIRINHGDGTSWAPSPTSSTRANQVLPHSISTLKRFVNRDVGCDVWQRSFHDHVVRGEQDYRDIWQYIDQNPTKWREDCFFIEE